jgi:uncharacterized membrane protein YbhN (UPF0104 family)
MRSHSFKRKFGLLVRSVLSIALIGGLAYHIGTREIFVQINAIRWQTMTLVVIVLASNVLIVTPRWALILAALGHKIRSATLIGSVFLGFLLNQLLPTAVGGDVLRALRARELGVPLDLAVHSVLIDRAVGVLVSLVGAAALLPFAETSVRQSLDWIVGAVAAAAIIGFFVLWALCRLPTLPIPVNGGLQRGLVGLRRSAWTLVTTPGAGPPIFMLAILGQFLLVVAVWLFANELHIAVAPTDITIITFVSTLAAAIPISIAGWGVREGTLVFLFGLYGIPPDVSFALSILLGASLALASAPGALVLLAGYGSPPPAERR